eukprot:scaffold28037_cov16-Tisochrysis_lutea.AAC.1
MDGPLLGCLVVETTCLKKVCDVECLALLCGTPWSRPSSPGAVLILACIPSRSNNIGHQMHWWPLVQRGHTSDLEVPMSPPSHQHPQHHPPGLRSWMAGVCFLRMRHKAWVRLDSSLLQGVAHLRHSELWRQKHSTSKVWGASPHMRVAVRDKESTIC